MKNNNIIAPLQTAHQRRHVKITLTTLATFASSSWMTAKGIMEKSIEAGIATIDGSVTAVMAALVASTALGTATIQLFNVAMDIDKRQKRHVVTLAATLLPFILCISTFYAILGNAGGASMVYDMRDKAPQWGAYVDNRLADASLSKSIKNIIQPMAKITCEMAHLEATKGVFSGYPGMGKASATLSSACTGLNDITQSLDNSQQGAAAHRAQTAEILQRLYTIPNDTALHVFSRQEAFRQETAALNDILAASGTENIADTVVTRISVVKDSIFSLGGENDSVLGKAQHQAAVNLQRALTSGEEKIAAVIAKAKQTQMDEPKALLESGAAVARYWQRNLPIIALAVMLDLIAMWFLYLLLVSRAAVHMRDEAMRGGDHGVVPDCDTEHQPDHPSTTNSLPSSSTSQ